MKKTYTVGISLTERCNLKCKHCYIGQKNIWNKMNYNPKEISLDQRKDLIPILKEINVQRINLGGGETPLHKDFINILKELYKAKMKISLTTNGTTFNIYKEYLHLFNDIGVSIDFPDERHSKFRGKEIVFSKAVSTLKSLVNEGIRTEMVTCIMKINYKDLKQIYNLAQKIGVDMWRLNRFHSSKNDLQRFKHQNSVYKEICKINADLSCTKKQFEKAFKFLASITPKKQDYVTPDPLFRTYIEGNGLSIGSPCGRLAFRIKSNGDVTPNVFTDCNAGNIFKDKIQNILSDESFHKYKKIKPQGKCRSCVNYKHCNGGDHTDSYLLLEDFEAQDPFCFLDPKIRKNIKIIPIKNTKFVHESYLPTIYIPIKNVH